MLKKTVLLLLLSALLAIPLSAAEPSDEELAHQLGTRLGLESMIESIRQQTRQTLEKQTAKMLQNYRTGLSGMPEEFFREMETMLDAFMQEIMTSWSAEQAIAIYTDSLVEDLPREQIEKSLAHYSSEEGQRELQAVNTAAMKLNAYVNEQVMRASDEASRRFATRLQELMQASQRERMEEPHEKRGE